MSESYNILEWNLNLRSIEKYIYSRKFAKDSPVYTENSLVIDEDLPYPDHAMLIGTINLYPKEALVLDEYFPNGGETYSREQLISQLLNDTGLDRPEAEKLIDYAVTNNWIYDAGNDCYTR